MRDVKQQIAVLELIKQQIKAIPWSNINKKEAMNKVMKQKNKTTGAIVKIKYQFWTHTALYQQATHTINSCIGNNIASG